MADACHECGKVLTERDWVFQLAWGIYFYGHSTPTAFRRSGVLGEWHFECFRLFDKRYQEPPYQCDHCRDPIVSQAAIVYGVCGIKPLSPYIRPEHRGDGLHFVVHERCWDPFIRARGRP